MEISCCFICGDCDNDEIFQITKKTRLFHDSFVHGYSFVSEFTKANNIFICNDCAKKYAVAKTHKPSVSKDKVSKANQNGENVYGNVNVLLFKFLGFNA